MVYITDGLRQVTNGLHYWWTTWTTLPMALTSSLTETPCNSGGKPGMSNWTSPPRCSSDLRSQLTGDNDRRGDMYGEASRRRLALLALLSGSATDDLELCRPDLDHPGESPAHSINDRPDIEVRTPKGFTCTWQQHISLPTRVISYQIFQSWE